MCTFSGCGGYGDLGHPDYRGTEWYQRMLERQSRGSDTQTDFSSTTITSNPDWYQISAGLANSPEAIAMNERNKRAGWLSQAEIDSTESEEPIKPGILNWLKTTPKGWSTLLVLACFLWGCLGAYLIWKMVK
jgi:hypothetical protein